MTTVRVSKGDWGKPITFTIKNPDTGAGVNISDATTRTITIGRIGKSTKLIDNQALDFKGGGTTGSLDFTPAGTGDLDIAGYYDVNIKLVYSSGQEIVEKFTLHIVDTI